MSTTSLSSSEACCSRNSCLWADFFGMRPTTGLSVHTTGHQTDFRGQTGRKTRWQGARHLVSAMGLEGHTPSAESWRKTQQMRPTRTILKPISHLPLTSQQCGRRPHPLRLVKHERTVHQPSETAYSNSGARKVRLFATYTSSVHYRDPPVRLLSHPDYRTTGTRSSGSPIVAAVGWIPTTWHC